ncbi:MAG: class A beta-lactamase-related serine hydrolase, partial [Bacteroidetes bacterium]|nr:class A beta-lactamase-related serine hydrolase [Bacteroidota bacterium]
MKNLIIIIISSITLLGCVKHNVSLHTKEKVEQDIRNLALEYGGIIGAAAKNFNTGETIFVNADSLFSEGSFGPTASVIKLAILVELFSQAKSKEVDLQKYVIVHDSIKVGGAGVLQNFDGDTKIKLIDAATLMIILSDNTATNIVIDQLGKEHDEKLNAVNNQMTSLGLENTKLLNKVFSYATKKNTYESKRFGLGFSSPMDMLMLLEKIYHHKIIDSSFSEQIISIMKNQHDDSMIRRYLPYGESISVANKTGAVDQSRIDVGIIYSTKADIGIAIFTDLSKETQWTHDNKAQNAVAKAARMIY